MKTKNKIMSIFLLPLSFTLFLPTNSISANLSEEQEKLISDFEIFSAQLDATTVTYADGETPVLDLTGSFSGNVSDIASANLTYDIKEDAESEYQNITVNIENNMINYYNDGIETYFFVRVPLYVKDSSNNFIPLKQSTNYQINNPIINITDNSSNNYSSLYLNDFAFKTEFTITDNGDQSYPKVLDAFFLNGNMDELTVVFSDAYGHNLTDTSNYSLYFHYDLYDMYDDSGIPSARHTEKLNPVGETSYISIGDYEGNYMQNYDFNYIPGTFQGYKLINTSFILVPNENSLKQSSIFVHKNIIIEPDITTNIVETDVNGTNDSLGYYRITDTYITLDFYYDQFENINSYAKYMEHIEISYDLTYQQSSVSSTTNHNVEAEEVDTMTTLLFNTPGLYYEEVNMDEANLHYQYTLVFPNSASWDTVEVNNVYVHFPLNADPFEGEKLTSTTTDYDYAYSSSIYQDLGITISWTNFTKDENFIW